MRDTKTEGFILKRIPYQNESVTLFSVFTHDFGKITLSGRPAKRINSSNLSLSPLNVCEFEIYRSEKGFFKAKKTVLKRSFSPVENIEGVDNLSVTQKIYTIAEIIDAAIEEGNPDAYLYELLIKSAKLIQETNSTLIFESFKTKFLELSGTLPNLKYCFNCNKKSEDDENWITHEDLHIHCAPCTSALETLSPLSQITLDTLKLLHFIKDAPFEDILKIKVTERELTNLTHLNDLLLSHILPKELRTTTHSLTN